MSKTHADSRFWRRLDLFKAFSDDALVQLDRIATERSWGSGEMLFQRGDDSDYMVVVTKGRIKLSLLTLAGRELTLRHAEVGETLGEMALLDGGVRSADATAAVASAGLVLQRAPFHRLLDAFPDASRSLVNYISRRLRDTTEQLESIALFEIEARLARFLIVSVRHHFGGDIPPSPHLRPDLNQSELAAMLGGSRPKVNRALHTLEQSGAIKRNGAIVRCDMARLELIADPDLA